MWTVFAINKFVSWSIRTKSWFNKVFNLDNKLISTTLKWKISLLNQGPIDMVSTSIGIGQANKPLEGIKFVLFNSTISSNRFSFYFEKNVSERIWHRPWLCNLGDFFRMRWGVTSAGVHPYLSCSCLAFTCLEGSQPDLMTGEKLSFLIRPKSKLIKEGRSSRGLRFF